MRSPSGFGPTRALFPSIAAGVLLLASSSAADAQRVERQGKEVVDAVCSTCHATGANHAPRIGDAQAWAARASQGLSALTDHAMKGIRNMPPHGGNAGLSDIELERAIVYMVNQSGGHWVEPLGGATPAVLRTSETIVREQCAKCHLTGQGGAPKIGDREAWLPRLKRGLDPLVASAIHGHGGMPARGGLPDLSDVELRGAILYMFNFGVPTVAAAPAEPPQAEDSRHKIVSGTDIYLGMMAAEALRAARRSAGESGNDIPSGKDYCHVNISLADSKSHVPLTDAQVKVKVSDGISSESRALALVAANQSVSYGSYFRMSSGGDYSITAQILRAGASTPIEAKFQVKAP
jgi:cytochrome c5